MQKKPIENIYFLLEGSLSDFYMLVPLFEEIFSKDKNIKIKVVTASNAQLFKEIPLSFPRLEIIDISSNFSFAKVLATAKRSNTLICWPNTHTNLRSKIKFFGRILTNSSFFPAVHNYKREHNPHKNQYENLIEIGKYLNFNLNKNPGKYKYHANLAILKELNLEVNKFFVLQTFSGSEAKTLEENRWKDIISLLKQNYPDHKIILTGGYKQEAAANNLLSDGVINICNKSDADKITVIDNCKVFIGVDSGLTHLASLLQKDVIELADYSKKSKLASYSPRTTVLNIEQATNEDILKNISHTNFADIKKLFSSNFNELREVMNTIEQDPKLMELMEFAGDKMLNCLKNKNKILMAGNGGSAAEAQHFSSELVGRFVKDRTSLPGISLTTDTSSLTAIGNDYGYDSVFERQVYGLGDKGDVLVLLSTSGNSKNLVMAAKAAREKGILTVGLLGRDGGQVANLIDIPLIIPSENSDRIQEIHLFAIHYWCEVLDAYYEQIK